MVELTAERGKTIRLEEPVEGVCVGCGEERDVSRLVVLLPVAGANGRVEGELMICGRCVSAALAVRLVAGVPDRDREIQL